MSAWTAEIVAAAMTPQGQLRIDFRYSNGTITIDEPFWLSSPGDDFVAKYAKQRTANLEALEAMIPTLPKGPIEIPPDPEPSAADLFFAKYREWKAKEAAAAKDLPVDAEAVAALAVEVKELFLPEYTADFRWSG